MRMRYHQPDDNDVALPFPGSLLVAHPSLLDPNFKHSVVLLTAHSDAEGSLGVIVNRPLNQTLGQYEPKLQNAALAQVPMYCGGPVADQQLILVAWKWNPQEGSFKLFFGINEAKAEELLVEDPEFELRAFVGHSGWGEGQLDAEIEEGAWVPSLLSPEIESGQADEIWRSILSQRSAELRILADEPEDPSLN